jgi:hypothetical protein
MTYSAKDPTESDVSSQTLFLRDYKYLDTKRLSDYLATVMPNKLEEIAQKFGVSKGREPDGVASNAAGIGRINWGRGDILEEDDVYERAIKIGAKQLFTQLHQMLRDHESIEFIPDNRPTGAGKLKTRDMVEITRKFKPALDDTIGHTSKFLEGLMFLDLYSDDAQVTLDSVREIEGKVIPVIAVPDNSNGEVEDASIIFLAEARFIIGGQVKNLEGNMAVCGKVQSKVNEDSVDLLELLSIERSKLMEFGKRLEQVLPTTLSRESVERTTPDNERPNLLMRLLGAEDPEEARERVRRYQETQKTKAEEAMGHWKAIDWESTKIRGPALVIMPLAVYT